ncbi:MFS transporter [Jejuia pallidilutea]|uniref:Putative membrane protein n=1 Tax=Jejuia pallidilutea TaxID=504487 RepID=A0A090W7V9_9FLAO|nr:MFS transporter [Jejuia pallidilutea]GAL68648.1 putative membrane protein [Jejuia pallidilutea]GAL72308.1 putative membrane protein [Jejuia pallidilutea]GAL89272.1 putative membrane protein [Jejuia pallidilutea]
MPTRVYILPIIVFSQFCCTSLWFAGNAIIIDLIENFNLEFSALAHLTSAVQFGFIIGTFVFAIFSIADRFSPSKVFFACATVAAAINSLTILQTNTIESLFFIRLATGFFLAGIYPVGMKIASDYFKEGLGKSLGYLVGALVLGTAFPHLLNFYQGSLSWKWVVYITSGLALLGGGLLLLFISDGPYKTKLEKFDISLFYSVFKIKHFRKAAFGYFGHMWELYAFWAFVPFILKEYIEHHESFTFNISLFSFVVIGIGGLSCVLSGYLSQKFTSKLIATLSLSLSFLCCLLSPLFFVLNTKLLFLGFLVFWGMAVIADSPLFSTLVAQNVPSKAKGTALTIVNCIGFAITIISIQLLNMLQNYITPKYLFLVLAIGPAIGLFGLYRSYLRS